MSKSKTTIYIILILVSLIPCLLLILPRFSQFQSLDLIVKALVITIPVSIQFSEEKFNFPDLILATQKQVDIELKQLTTKPIRIVLFDDLGNESQQSTKYVISLVLSDRNSLAVASDESKAFVFYNLQSIQSNDLPYLITQTLLYHLVHPDIHLSNRSVAPIEDLCLKFEVGRSIWRNETNLTQFAKDIYSSIRQFESIFKFSYQTRFNPDLIDNQVKLHFESQTYNLDSIESSLVDQISDTILDRLGLPKYPSNNVNLKLYAYYRHQTLHNLYNLVSTAKYNNKIASKLTSFVRTLNEECKVSWFEHLVESISM